MHLGVESEARPDTTPTPIDPDWCDVTEVVFMGWATWRAGGHTWIDGPRYPSGLLPQLFQ